MNITKEKMWIQIDLDQESVFFVFFFQEILQKIVNSDANLLSWWDLASLFSFFLIECEVLGK